MKIAMAMLIALLLIQPAVAFEVKSVTVKPASDGVVVGVNYTLDPITALKVFLFGAKTIENDVLSIFNASNYTILRIGYSHAEFLFPAKKAGNVTYFEGVNLTVPVNVTIVAGSPVRIGCVSRIPSVYFCTTSNLS